MINSLGGDIHTLAEMKQPPDHPHKIAAADPSPEPTVSLFADAERRVLEAKEITIDIMLLYTKNAASHFIQHPADLMPLVIDDANETFKNSGLGNVTLRLVHSQAIDFNERGADHFSILYGMVDGLGSFMDVKKLRNEKRADIVGLIIDDANGCGLSTRVGADLEGGYILISLGQYRFRSSSVASRAVRSRCSPRIWRCTSGLDLRLRYQPGFPSRPPNDAGSTTGRRHPDTGSVWCAGVRSYGLSWSPVPPETRAAWRRRDRWCAGRPRYGHARSISSPAGRVPSCGKCLP